MVYRQIASESVPKILKRRRQQDCFYLALARGDLEPEGNERARSCGDSATTLTTSDTVPSLGGHEEDGRACARNGSRKGLRADLLLGVLSLGRILLIVSGMILRLRGDGSLLVILDVSHDQLCSTAGGEDDGCGSVRMSGGGTVSLLRSCIFFGW